MDMHTPPAVTADPALLEAKESWLNGFTGAVLDEEHQIGSPMVQNLYKRTFYITARNFHYISVFGRVLLGEDHVKEPENFLRAKMETIKAKLDVSIKEAQVLIEDANLKVPYWNAPSHVVVKITSAFSKRHWTLLQLADQYMLAITTLWLNDQIDDKDRAKREHEIKKELRGLALSARTMFVGLRRRQNEKSVAAAETGAASKPGDATNSVAASSGTEAVTKPGRKRAASKDAVTEQPAAEAAVA